MLQGVAALKLKDNLHFLISLHTESNKHISHAEFTKTLCPNFSEFTFLRFLKLQYS